jgi:hypothetical protein
MESCAHGRGFGSRCTACLGAGPALGACLAGKVCAGDGRWLPRSEGLFTINLIAACPRDVWAEGHFAWINRPEPNRSRNAAFDRLAGNGAELVTTEMVAFEWLRTAEHEAFKDVLGLVK